LKSVTAVVIYISLDWILFRRECPRLPCCRNRSFFFCGFSCNICSLKTFWLQHDPYSLGFFENLPFLTDLKWSHSLYFIYFLQLYLHHLFGLLIWGGWQDSYDMLCASSAGNAIWSNMSVLYARCGQCTHIMVGHCHTEYFLTIDWLLCHSVAWPKLKLLLWRAGAK
jgi:hypothetical protein